MAKFLLGERSGIHIIDLEKSLACIRQASSVTADIASKGGKILFVGTGESIQRLTYEAASFSGQFYVNKRWVGGTISNCKSIIKDNVTPDLVIIFDLKRNLVAAKECQNGNIPLIAVCDSDCNPDIVTYPIPANDESLPGIELIAKVLAISAGRGGKGNAILSQTND
jgi:small subunit ribosomal protein S2